MFEFYAIVKGSSQSLGEQAPMRDLNVHCKIKTLTDATTGKAIAARRGPGRVRHIDVSNLWIQEKIADESIGLQKIKNVYNPGDRLYIWPRRKCSTAWSSLTVSPSTAEVP